MDKFGYNAAWKRHKLLGCAYPIVGLAFMLATWILVVIPSQGNPYASFEFKGWAPLFAIALVVWAAMKIMAFMKANAFAIELSDETIRVGDGEAKWSEVTRIETRTAYGEDAAIVLHTSTGVLQIPAATASLAYIKGFVDSHTRVAPQA